MFHVYRCVLYHEYATRLPLDYEVGGLFSATNLYPNAPPCPRKKLVNPGQCLGLTRQCRSERSCWIINVSSPDFMSGTAYLIRIQKASNWHIEGERHIFARAAGRPCGRPLCHAPYKNVTLTCILKKSSGC